MKKDTQPVEHEIAVLMSAGTAFKTRTTWGKEGDVLTLDVDPLAHQGWGGAGQQLIDTEGQVARLNERFEGLGLNMR